jgi:hypothetical protein
VRLGKNLLASTDENKPILSTFLSIDAFLPNESSPSV